MNKFLEKIKTKNIHIVGVSGTEGSAVLEFFIKNGIKSITAHDFSRDQEEFKNNFFKTHLWLKGKEKIKAFENFLQLPIKLKLKDKYLEGVDSADIVFVPSSWYLYKPNFPGLEDAKKKSIEFSSLTKLYFEMAKGKIISVTGTKGKGTTSRLIYEILLKSGKKKNVYLAGNDRRSAQEPDKVSKMGKDNILVLETSNRQLTIDLGRSPDIGIITNISPDHIDEHGSFEKYIAVKKSLFQYTKKDNVAVLNYDNEITKKIGEELITRGIKVFFFSRKSEVKSGACVENGKIFVKIKSDKKEICDLRDIKLLGEHNIENVLAAALVGSLAGAEPEEIKKTIQDFQGLPHRIEFIGEYNGVKFYDDLASTNPDSTIVAIKALNELRIKSQESRMILIMGGDDKGMDYAGMTEEIVGKVDILILLPGTGSDIIKNQIINAECQKMKLFEYNDFLEALDLLKEQIKTGDIVLISPASAHFQARYIDILKKPIRNLIVEKFNLSS
ncbi:MAG: UDP-N-acetylmuramoyl-L-alanine--D-glutamate ligase [bacterium]|nr:UDP-N-acetylmuramoyl-L-alanine--D-glutamate ligase [bacterium]